MKRVYFVRHGETIYNQEHRVQGPDIPLSEAGLLQAEKIATRAENIDFQKIISSPYTRARQTADAISRIKGMPILESALFREVMRPSSLWGKEHAGPEVQNLFKQEEANTHDPLWKMEDGDSFQESIDRAHEALQFLIDQEEDEILVVTHGKFLKMLVLSFFMKDHMNPEHGQDFISTLYHASNTAITVCFYEKDQWKLFTWNDHAHFAE